MKSLRALNCLIFISLVIFLSSGCQKDEGQGGTSTIVGHVVINSFQAGFNPPVPETTYAAVDEDTYIIYGADHSTYNDNYKTSFDGSYEYKYLQKGKYRIFAYSKDSTGAYLGNASSTRPKIPVFVDVEITENGQTVTAPTLTILKDNQ
ncbi:MAG: hypothetical protein IPP51_06170 [Bacteroidetes bacterium]|nr:hypothetical protein [Bacteroidota bacterium]